MDNNTNKPPPAKKQKPDGDALKRRTSSSSTETETNSIAIAEEKKDEDDEHTFAPSSRGGGRARRKRGAKKTKSANKKKNKGGNVINQGKPKEAPAETLDRPQYPPKVFTTDIMHPDVKSKMDALANGEVSLDDFEIVKLLRCWPDKMECGDGTNKNKCCCLCRYKKLAIHPTQCVGNEPEVHRVICELEVLRLAAKEHGADGTLTTDKNNYENIAGWFNLMNRFIAHSPLLQGNGKHLMISATWAQPEPNGEGSIVADDDWKDNEEDKFPILCHNGLYYLLAGNVDACQNPTADETLAHVFEKLKLSKADTKYADYLDPDSGFPNLYEDQLMHLKDNNNAHKNRNQSHYFFVFQNVTEIEKFGALKGNVKKTGRNKVAYWRLVNQSYGNPKNHFPLMKESGIKELVTKAIIPIGCGKRDPNMVIVIVDHRLDQVKTQNGSNSNLVLPNGWKDFIPFDGIPGTLDRNPYGSLYVAECKEQLLDELRLGVDRFNPGLPYKDNVRGTTIGRAEIDFGKTKWPKKMHEDSATTVVEFNVKHGLEVGMNGLLDVLPEEGQVRDIAKKLCDDIGAVGKSVAKKFYPEYFSDDSGVDVTIAASFDVILGEKNDIRVQVPHRENDSDKLDEWQKAGVFKFFAIIPLDAKGLMYRVMLGDETTNNDDHLVHVRHGSFVMMPASVMKGGGFLTDRGGNPALNLTVLVSKKGSVTSGSSELEDMLVRNDGSRQFHPWYPPTSKDKRVLLMNSALKFPVAKTSMFKKNGGDAAEKRWIEGRKDYFDKRGYSRMGALNKVYSNERTETFADRDYKKRSKKQRTQEELDLVNDGFNLPGDEDSSGTLVSNKMHVSAKSGMFRF